MKYGVATMNPKAKVRVTPDNGCWGVYDAQLLAVSPDVIPAAVRRTKEEADTCAEYHA
jgi:hypothetical protein